MPSLLGSSAPGAGEDTSGLVLHSAGPNSEVMQGSGVFRTYPSFMKYAAVRAVLRRL